MNKTAIRSSIFLLLAAVIWGFAFVAQSVGMDYVGPYTFNCVRCFIGGIVLIPCIAFLDHRKERFFRGDTETITGKTSDRKTLLCGGICCGVVLCVASNLQQIGIQYTSVGKAGFITAMYIVLVPVISVLLKKKVVRRIWIGVALSLAGLYLLCITERFSVGSGDILMLLCAFMFAVHILVIDYFSPKADPVRMSCIQFFVCSFLSGIFMFLFESPSISTILQAWIPIVYSGVLSCGVAYTMQIVGQRDLNPTAASLILCLESVVSALAGWAILGQTMTARELSGCVLIFAAILFVQTAGLSRSD